ncbi:MAG TPA: flagellar basal body rod protein FlgB [Spirochaetia bacterium]|nr:flagellar basal body rod protein FlgB [Spirochaetia bacterium]
MFLNNSFGKTLDIMQRSMDVSMLRQDVIADNIANADTPNFKRSTINFESQLNAALASENAPRPMQAAMTHERHISFSRPVDYRSVQPQRQLDYLTTADNNGNNVDIEVESMNFLNNQLLYSLMTNSVTQQFQRVNLVVRG